MSLVLYNDLTRKKEPFVPLKDGEVGFYSCGPTVYDYFHIGNARPFIVFDVLRRYMEFSGYRVTFVQNFTDVDDKMISRANEMGITVQELAEKTIADYFEDADALGIKRATHYPRATEHIEEIVDLVRRLEESGHAYEVDGVVYFHVSSFPGYGKLSRQNIEELQSGSRIEVNSSKKNPLDFVLWKAQKPGEPAWDSPWGKGRPGWHIECSAMAMKYLGNTLDIHSGGTDLTFPHHENEIAQAEAATEEIFVRYWLHNEYILIDKEKMSKSLGNFMTAREARKHYSPLAIRMFMLGAHYRSPVNFGPEGLQQATAALERLHNCWSDFRYAVDNRPHSQEQDDVVESIKRHRDDFVAAMDDDFNTAGAIGHIFEAVSTVNGYLKDSDSLSSESIKAVEDFFRDVDSIMGLIGLDSDGQDDDSEEIESLIRKREEARSAKDFATSDAIRDQLAAKGVILEDTPQGTKWKKKI
ncbi:cysteine--tRNA ligase [Dethiosulfovibrio sp. F2B]|uniref:cysteine--tRNA ligase n=1 Tax=Dethiosulfovibrio faecalis TaxID=2720018 RepID=UPI001F028B67|nr:cysteine--tRNA ligase [Dethiosulfovibrio faecalis]MCF4150423.1 cysteine--tRNA ligase [Dethiosulfovibrio faecalis]